MSGTVELKNVIVYMRLYIKKELITKDGFFFDVLFYVRQYIGRMRRDVQSAFQLMHLCLAYVQRINYCEHLVFTNSSANVLCIP